MEINPVQFPSRSEGDDLGKPSLQWLSKEWIGIGDHAAAFLGDVDRDGYDEVIVLAQHGGRTEPIAMERWERLGFLPAVRAGRVHGADGDVLHRYGPRVVEGIEALCAAVEGVR